MGAESRFNYRTSHSSTKLIAASSDSYRIRERSLRGDEARLRS